MTPLPQFEGIAYRASGKLQGRVAIVTGGDSGIGRSVAVLFAREGANVCIVHLPAEARDAATTISHIENCGQRGIAIAGDVRKPSFCRRVVSTTLKTLGRLDILVNNAAYQHSQPRLEDITEAQLRRTFETNIFGYFFMAQAAIAHLKPGSSIINCGSITGLEGSKHLLDYASTKGAIHAFSKSLALNLVDRGIRVNCVAPGPIWTPLNVADKPAAKVAKHGASVPLARPGQPDEVAPAFVFFASEGDSSYISGEVIAILGGATTAG